MQKCTLTALFVASLSPLFAQHARTVEINRQSTVPTLDGQLTDTCWQGLPPLEAFITSTPVFGRSPLCSTTVRLFYTDDALWIAAYCHDPEATSIRRDQGLRDGALTGDWFQVRLDTWNDDQLSFDFTVTAAGVQSDARQLGANWDAAWQSAVTDQSDGWSLEIRIPFTALRFPRRQDQTWGLQCVRFDRSSGELSTWSPQNPLVGDAVLQFGAITGLHDLHQARRRSLALHSNTKFNVETGPFGNPSLVQSIGADARIGLNESATLDFTLLPARQLEIDWGSILQPIRTEISGDVELPEPRQLLEEERDLFEKNGGISYAPQLYGGLFAWRAPVDTGELILKFTSSKLLQATKLSARTKGNWRFGVYNALLGPVGQEVVNPDKQEVRKETLQAVSDYNFLAAEYVLPNNSFVHISNGSTLAGPGVASARPQLRLRLRDASNTYELAGSTLYQYTKLDTNTYSGYRYNCSIARINHRWGWSLSHNQGYRTLAQPDNEPAAPQFSSSQAYLNYRDFRPYWIFQNITAAAGVDVVWRLTPAYRNNWNLNADFSGLDGHFRRYYLSMSARPYTSLKRYGIGGAYIDQEVAPIISGAFQFTADSRKRLIWNCSLFGTTSLKGEYPGGQASVGATWVPGSRISLEAGTVWQGYFQTLALLTVPGQWVFERYTSMFGQGRFGVNWYPVKQFRLFGMINLTGSQRYGREAVELQSSGELTPVNIPLPAYDRNLQGEIILGLQWFFTPLSQIRFEHVFGPDNSFALLPVTSFPGRFSETNLSVIYFLN